MKPKTTNNVISLKDNDNAKNENEIFNALGAMSAESLDYKKAFNIMNSSLDKKKINDKDDKTLNDMHIFFLDSAANGSYFNNEILSDTPIINLIDSTMDNVTVAGGGKIPIDGYGYILNHKANYTPTFHTSLLSVQNTLDSNDSVALFSRYTFYVASLHFGPKSYDNT